MPGIFELMRCMGRHDHHISSLYFEFLLSNRKDGLTALHDKNLFIGMNVQPGAKAGSCIQPEEGNRDISVFLSLETTCVIADPEALSGNDRGHIAPFIERFTKFCSGETITE